MAEIATDKKNSRPALSSLQIAPATQATAVLWTFAVTLFVSALLLFSVQPLFAKMALPKLGGAPAVWAVSMCFFQAMLLAGYCYAYALICWLDLRATVVVHAVVLLATLVALPIGLPGSLAEPPAGDAYFWLLGMLAAGVGLPFFAVAANAPLLQAWFTQTGHPAAQDPYFLYGASNAGSLIALLAYPLLVEPSIGLHMQSWAWSAGFGCLVILLLGSAAWMLARQDSHTPGAASQLQSATTDSVAATPISTADRASWTLLALIPSALMVAVTSFITTDLTSAPLFWVIPLALFLLTFILVFRDRALLPLDVVSRAVPILFVAVLSLPYPGLRLVLALAAFVAATLICHGQLYAKRPAAQHLTEFYLWMSLGGALGGVFSALIAPQIFASAFEFMALMIAALFCRPEVLDALKGQFDLRRFSGIACLVLSALITQHLASRLGGDLFARGAMAIILCGLGLTLWFNRTHPALQAGVMLGIGLFGWMLPDSQLAVHTARSFFGVVRVIETADGATRLMQHGTTLHGSRRLMGADGAGIDQPRPATYYHPAGPLARGVALARQVTTGSSTGAIRMGVVGLGTGSMACYTQPRDTLIYFEIDPVVAQIAQDARYFDFLSRCRPGSKIVMGDARLTLGKQADAAFDYLVIDAFSSDSVPAHLLTAEAMQLYLDKLALHGVLALHVSNRYLDLVSAVTATARTLPGTTVRVVEFGGVAGDPDAQPSQVVFIALHRDILASMTSWPDAQQPGTSSVTPWSDDFSDVLSAIVRHMLK